MANPDPNATQLDRLQSSIESLTRDIADTIATVRSLAGTVQSVNSRIGTVEQRQSDSAKPNWAPVGIVASALTAVLIGGAGLGGGLIGYAILQESQGRETGDSHLSEMFTAILEERDRTQQSEIARVVERSDLGRQLLESEIARVDGDISAATDRLTRFEDSVLRLRSEIDLRFAEMDNVLQREMRLLDEVLQREMNLHVDRLDSLIAVLDRSVKSISESRFTAREADRLRQELLGITAKP